MATTLAQSYPLPFAQAMKSHRTITTGASTWSTARVMFTACITCAVAAGLWYAAMAVWTAARMCPAVRMTMITTASCAHRAEVHEPDAVEHGARRAGQPHPHPHGTAKQVSRLGQTGSPLALSGGGQQDRQDLFFVVFPERPGVAGDEPPVAALKVA